MYQTKLSQNLQLSRNLSLAWKLPLNKLFSFFFSPLSNISFSFFSNLMTFVCNLMTFVSNILSPLINTLLFSFAICGTLTLQGCAVTAVSSATATGSAIAYDRRTAGTMLDDQAIEVKALHALSRKKDLWQKSHISVLSYNNAVLLVGQTPSELFKYEAERTTLEIPRTQKIYNEISIQEPISLATRAQDTWITGQIRAKLFTTKNLRSQRIKILTEDGVVYLMGLTTPQEQAMATNVARAVPNVEKVVQIFDTVDE